MKVVKLVFSLLLAVALLGACSRRSAEAPAARSPTLKAPDGHEYVLLAQGAHKPYFDAQGHLERDEWDRNGDGRADQVAHYGGARIPSLVDNDDDFDGRTDSWFYYDPAGVLQKVGMSRRGGDRPDTWIFPGPDGKPLRQEYDDDGDGRVERAELRKDGSLAAAELDADRDGRPDRWQTWESGRLVREDLDTDGDGKPDRRLRYGRKGEVVGLEPLSVR